MINQTEGNPEGGKTVEDSSIVESARGCVDATTEGDILEMCFRWNLLVWHSIMVFQNSESRGKDAS